MFYLPSFVDNELCGATAPIEANWKTERHHYEEADETRKYATYNPQVARDQMFQLGIHEVAQG